LTLPFRISLGDFGYRRALLEDKHLRNGLNVYRGKVTYKAVADDLGYKYVNPESALAA
jgi:alanine dehydrogenase